MVGAQKSVDWAFLDSFSWTTGQAIAKTPFSSLESPKYYSCSYSETVHPSPTVFNPFFLFHSKDLPDEVRERWETFCTNSLGETNKRNTVDLVGFTGSISGVFGALGHCLLT